MHLQRGQVSQQVCLQVGHQQGPCFWDVGSNMQHPEDATTHQTILSEHTHIKLLTVHVPCPGFPEHDAWILYAPEGDRSLGMRNWLAYNSARRMGRYAMRTQYVEVFLVQVGGPEFLMGF